MQDEQILPRPTKIHKLQKAVENTQAELKGVGWFQICKLEKRGGVILEQPVDWMMGSEQSGQDAYAALNEHIKVSVLPEHGVGDYVAKPCTPNREPIKDAEFFSFKFDEKTGGIKMDFEDQDIQNRQKELKRMEQRLQIAEMERRLHKKEEEMNDDKKEKSPISEEMQKFMMMKTMFNGTDEVSDLKTQIGKLETSLASPKEDKMTTLLFQMMQDEKSRRAEEDRRREERSKIEEERRKEELRRMDEERKEERRRFEEQQKFEREKWEKHLEEERRRFDENMKIHRQELETKELRDREFASREQERMMNLMKMMKDDSGGATKHIIEMTKNQAMMMSNASASQFNMATAATKAMMELGELYKQTMGKDSGSEPESVVSTVIKQAGDILKPYAEVDAQAKAIGAISDRLGLTPQQVMELKHLVPQLSGGGSRSPQPVPMMNVPMGRTNGQASEGGIEMALIDKFMESAPEVVESIVNGMKEKAEPDEFLDMIFEQPATVRTIILYHPMEKLSGSIEKYLSADHAKTFMSNKEWWTKFKTAIKQAIKEERDLDTQESQEVATHE